MEHAELIQKIAEDLIVAGAGAYFGARGAQLIAEKSKFREELLKEIRNTNATISIAFNICNSLLSMKSQYVKAMKENYDAQRAEFFAAEQTKARAAAGNGPTEIYFKTNLQTLVLPYQPIEVLQEQMFKNLSVKGRTLNLAMTLARTIQSLKASHEMRNSLIGSYRASNLTGIQILILYFGAPYGGGHVDTNYPSLLGAIYSQTNDGIHFSKLLCEDLVKYGEQLVEQFKKKFKGSPRIDTPDFTPAIKAGLMPPDVDYTSWVSSFVERPPPPLTRFERFKRTIQFWKKK
jgi:hypothetical protein